MFNSPEANSLSKQVRHGILPFFKLWRQSGRTAEDVHGFTDIGEV
ncbi:protein of unknown function [Brevefilum fermentans]|uniref:Uncharacterized protein n=1 Tax=Candidatus Brevifilum fermentans TaxID=1986204 RepID=A0A1Y6K7M6_9CHLR|nr:protein of unknown function [Brevefilum fermentans]